MVANASNADSCIGNIWDNKAYGSSRLGNPASLPLVRFLAIVLFPFAPVCFSPAVRIMVERGD